jgi:hypothetical protein
MSLCNFVVIFYLTETFFFFNVKKAGDVDASTEAAGDADTSTEVTEAGDADASTEVVGDADASTKVTEVGDDASASVSFLGLVYSFRCLIAFFSLLNYVDLLDDVKITSWKWWTEGNPLLVCFTNGSQNQ